MTHKVKSNVNFHQCKRTQIDNETVSRRLLSFAFFSLSLLFLHQSRPFLLQSRRVARKTARGGERKQTRVICLLQFYEPKTFCLFHDVRIRNQRTTSAMIACIYEGRIGERELFEKYSKKSQNFHGNSTIHFSCTYPEE